MVDVEDHRVPSAHTKQGVRDSGAGSACAEQNDLLQPCAGQAEGEATGEPGQVGVVADCLDVAENHGVDRSQRGGLGGQVVEVGQDGLLSWICDVQAGVAGQPGCGD